MQTNFQLSSDDCEILLAFEDAGSLQVLSEKMLKDISVLSRSLKNISLKAPVLEKLSGRWVLTRQGAELNKWTRDAIYSQQLRLGNQREVRIVSTREFATRILVPNIKDLIGEDHTRASIMTTDEGIESYILEGKADFGFDCGRPIDPAVSFKVMAQEDFVYVASAKYCRSKKVETTKDLVMADRLYLKRCENILHDEASERPPYFGIFYDLATIREACLYHHGWATLPYYAVKNEIIAGKLIIIEGAKLEKDQYSVWWKRERDSILPWIKKAKDWLKNQEIHLCLEK
jgi:DNA-binding transcriptional LysR family regulator